MLCRSDTFMFIYLKKKTLLTAIMSTNMSHEYNVPWFLSTTSAYTLRGYSTKLIWGGRDSRIVVKSECCSSIPRQHKRIHVSHWECCDPAVSYT